VNVLKVVNSGAVAARGPLRVLELDGNAAMVMKGTILVRPTVFEKWLDTRGPEAKSDGSWLIVHHAAAHEVEEELLASGKLLFSGDSVDASAFGCDGRVFERAIDRAVRQAARAGFDHLEIVDIARREDSGLDYVSIRARAKEVREAPTWGFVDVRSSSDVQE